MERTRNSLTFTVKATRRYLSVCLEQAIKSDLLLKNPVKQTKSIKLVKAEIQTLTEGQADSLTAAAYTMAQEADKDYALRAAKAAEKASQMGKYMHAHVLPEMQTEVVKVLDGVFSKIVNTQR